MLSSALLQRSTACGATASLCRWFSSSLGSAANSETPDIFDRDTKAAHRSRMAFVQAQAKACSQQSQDADPLVAECADRLVDRLKDVVKSFQSCLVLGGSGNVFLERFLQDETSRSIRHVSYVDQAPELVHAAQQTLQAHQDQPGSALCTFSTTLADEEFLPFAAASHDLVIACNSLHWVNDLPQAFRECRRVLQPDGLFMGSVFGGDTLFELRTACNAAQEERQGGISARLSPLMHVRDAGSLLSGANFSLQTVDSEELTLQYDNVTEPISHLRELAEQGAAANESPPLSRDTALAAAALYGYSIEGGERVPIQSTFQIIFMTGWAPDPKQPRAAKRGSATASMKDIQAVVAAAEDTRRLQD